MGSLYFKSGFSGMLYCCKKIFPLSLLALLLISYSVMCVDLDALAGENLINGTDQVEIDGKLYEKSQIISDFLDIAFSQRLWNEDQGKNIFEKRLGVLTSSKEMTPPPELFSRRLIQGALPKSGVINKWPSNISVGIGIPGAGNAYVGFIEQNEVAINSILLALEGAIQKKIQIVDIGAVSPSDFSGILIVPDERLEASYGDFSGGPFVFEPQLWQAVPVREVTGNSEMKAYYLPNDSNHIGLSVCRIKIGSSMQLQTKLLTTCLLASLGLPNVPDVESIDSYNWFLLSILYCSDVKAGMSKNEVIQVLSRNNSCF